MEDKGVPVEKRRPVKIFLHTPGGNISVTMGLCDAILASTTPVWTINAGWAMSAGGLILICGHRRFCTRSSVALIHSASGGSSGTMQQVKDSTQFMERLNTMGNKLILEKTKISPRMLSSKKNNDWYIFAEDQINYGLADKIIENIDEVV